MRQGFSSFVQKRLDFCFVFGKIQYFGHTCIVVDAAPLVHRFMFEKKIVFLFISYFHM